MSSVAYLTPYGAMSRLTHGSLSRTMSARTSTCILMTAEEVKTVIQDNLMNDVLYIIECNVLDNVKDNILNDIVNNLEHKVWNNIWINVRYTALFRHTSNERHNS